MIYAGCPDFALLFYPAVFWADFLHLFVVLQARLTKQEEDNERERHRLEDLIARMESQNRDQLRQLEEVGD